MGHGLQRTSFRSVRLFKREMGAEKRGGAGDTATGDPRKVQTGFAPICKADTGAIQAVKHQVAG
jgi:hypothetical protein